MPRSINGIGTFYYGREDGRADGSYVTTEYAVFFFFPLFPLRTLRVRRLAFKDSTALQALGALYEGGAQTRVDYQVLETMPLRAGQVIQTFTKGWLLVPVVLLWPLAVMGVLGHFYGVRGTLKANGIPPAVMIPCGIAAFAYAVLMAAQVLSRARRG